MTIPKCVSLYSDSHLDGESIHSGSMSNWGTEVSQHLRTFSAFPSWRSLAIRQCLPPQTQFQRLEKDEGSGVFPPAFTMKQAMPSQISSEPTRCYWEKKLTG